MSKRSSLVRILALPALLVAASCSDVVRPAAAPAGEPRHSAGTGATLLECPTSTPRSASALIGPLGGVVELDGHRLVIPLGAVMEVNQFTLTVPASNYMEVDIRAGGAEHFQFAKPVSVTIDYSRCTRSNTDRDALRIFYIDEASKAILADMGGSDDKTARVVSTSTGHLSGYAIGTP